MPVTFYHKRLDNKTIEKLQKLYPPGMMLSRTKIIPLQNVEKCALCGDCVLSCPTEALLSHRSADNRARIQHK
ncbi:MAG: 4Fe-4S binding protein [Deltaproteobacteria bacterium]|nr:4Fe-4S binding protein [Deltaproteobacteria bacterium]